MLLSSEVMELAQQYATYLLEYGAHKLTCHPKKDAVLCDCRLLQAREYARNFLRDFPLDADKST
jgi:hypothetical protein